MPEKKIVIGILISLFVFCGMLLTAAAGSHSESKKLSFPVSINMPGDIYVEGNQPVALDKIAASIRALSLSRNTRRLQVLADSLIVITGNYARDSSLLAELFYYIGVSKTLAGDNDAIKWLEQTIWIKEKLGVSDEHYANSFYNIGVTYHALGDFRQVCPYMLDYISVAAKLYGENSRQVAQAYAALIGASVGMQDYKKFNDYTFIALGILGKNNAALNEIEQSNLYQNIGTGYLFAGDYAKARLYLEEAEALRIKNHMTFDDEYINVINSLAITYGYLGQKEKESEYFTRGVDLAVENDSYLALNMINTYVIGLGNAGKISEGEAVLSELVRKLGALYGSDSRNYYETLRNYAEYLMDYCKDYPKSVECFEDCIRYLDRHKENAALRALVLAGYSKALFRSGETERALGVIQNSFLGGDTPVTHEKLYLNPQVDSLNPDYSTLNNLRLKYEILWSLYSVSGDKETLKAAASTSALTILLIDKMRMNISEEESRILLGDRYRGYYMDAIRDFELSFRKTGEKEYLEKAFEFAERCKAAGLLASTREMNAISFRIPENIADYESSLKRDISFYNSRIAIENEKPDPDKKIISGWKTKLLTSIKARDSLVMTFEKDFPGYFSIKYMNSFPRVYEIPSIIGRNNNYINYVVSDSLLYIFLVNRRHQEIITCKIDSGFLSDVKIFRSLLSDRDASSNARDKFNNYQKIGYSLYNTLIEPAKKYFISDNLIISPDNILSYLPFETIISSVYEGQEILYRKLNYLMNDYNISYNYSAAFMKEIEKRESRRTNELVVFAPVYKRTIIADSLFMNRQAESGILSDLPYARQEAEYVSKLTGGVEYLNNEAKESVFKSVAGKYDIIHLAMHTWLNDLYPMNSAMIFSQIDDTPEDGLLHTYEVYGIPLKARMVVLSSCNTGSGVLSTGEGILSLARGFLYSGSQSVIMSMWEVEDKSGTDIIDLFYHNLNKGVSKSEALKKARKEYLKKAGQLKSHPYFWSTLVIYGENSPIYPGWTKLILIVCSLILLVSLIAVYFWKRRYS
jgi:CHAT domain-containing protein